MGAQLRLRSFFIRRISTHFQMFLTALMTLKHYLTDLETLHNRPNNTNLANLKRWINDFKTLYNRPRNTDLPNLVSYISNFSTRRYDLQPTTFLPLSVFHHSEFELQFSLFEVGTTTLLFSPFIDIIIEKHGKMFDNTKQINYFCIYSQRQITT